MTYLIHDADGRPVSIGTVIADPLPDGLTAVPLDADDQAGLRAGSRRWDAATRTVTKTPGWLNPDVVEANSATIRQQAETALAANRTFLALGAPTNAQTLAQVRALTRQMNGLIRLTISHLDGTD